VAKHHKRLLVGIALGIAVSAVAIGSSAINGRISNAGSEATDKVRVVDDRKLPERWAINAAYGRGALSNLQAALTEIAKDNAQEAKKGVTVAQSLLDKIKPESPYKADFILVHSQVRVLDDADPTSSVQEKLDSIRREFEMIDHEAIVAALDSMDVPLAYTRVDLPLTRTVALVNEALQALNSQDANRARDRLMEIGNGLRIKTVHIGTEDSPVDLGNEDDAS
jgi:hypothetical protein